MSLFSCNARRFPALRVSPRTESARGATSGHGQNGGVFRVVGEAVVAAGLRSHAAGRAGTGEGLAGAHDRGPGAKNSVDLFFFGSLNEGNESRAGQPCDGRQVAGRGAWIMPATMAGMAVNAEGWVAQDGAEASESFSIGCCFGQHDDT